MNAPIIPDASDNGESDFNIGTNHGAIYVARTMNIASGNVSASRPKYFSNTVKVSVSINSGLMNAYVFRGNSLIPMFNQPDLTDSNTLTFFFNKPETGYIM